MAGPCAPGGDRRDRRSATAAPTARMHRRRVRERPARRRASRSRPSGRPTSGAGRAASRRRIRRHRGARTSSRIGAVSTNAWPVNSTHGDACRGRPAEGPRPAPSIGGKRPVRRGRAALRERMHGARDYVRRHARRCHDHCHAPAEDGPVRRSDRGDAGFAGMLLTEAAGRRTPRRPRRRSRRPGLELSTGVAVAFPRSPMITAQLAWELQEADRRFVPARPRHAGADPRRAAVRRRVRSSRATSARLRPRRQGVLRRIPRRTPRSSRRVLRADVPQRAVEPGTDRRTRPKVDIAAVNPWMLQHGGRGRRRRPRPPDR